MPLFVSNGAGGTTTVVSNSGTVSFSFAPSDFAAGFKDSAFTIPASSIAVARYEILTAFDGGATMSLGTPATPTLFATTANVDLTLIGVRRILGTQLISAKVRVTLAGAPTVGRCTVYVDYALPQS